jgi:hypothetical protein
MAKFAERMIGEVRILGILGSSHTRSSPKFTVQKKNGHLADAPTPLRPLQFALYARSLMEGGEKR